MEDFIAYSFLGLSAVLCILGLSSGRRVWTLKERGLRFARDILPLALVSMDAWGGIPAFLLTADIMFCDAVLLQSVTVPQPRSRIPFMAILGNGFHGPPEDGRLSREQGACPSKARYAPAPWASPVL